MPQQMDVVSYKVYEWRWSRVRSTDAVENGAHFVLECPLYNPIEKFPSIFENVILRSLKSFFQLDQFVDINFYLTHPTTLHGSKKLADLKPS
jgi:hypothetical protein